MADEIQTPASATIAMTDVPAIDMTAIVKLAKDSDLGSAFVSEITNTFLNDMGERVVKIRAQMEARDGAGIGATAHALKGSSGHFGARRLTALCAEIEARARRGEVDGIEEKVQSMLAEAERVRDALEAYRN